MQDYRTRSAPFWHPGPGITGLRVLCLLALGVALLGACGYQNESIRLPADARLVALGTIRNFTYTAELDVRVREALQQRLMANSAVRLVPRLQADLVLDIDIRNIGIDRGRDLSSSSVGRLVYILNSTASLSDRRNGKTLIKEQPVNASARLDFDQAVLDTPAVRDLILSHLMTSFSSEIENFLFYTY